MVRGGKFYFFFIFLLEQHWRASPDIFQSDFTLSADTFEQHHTQWIALWQHAPQKGPKYGELFLEKKENFRQTFLTVSVCHLAIFRGDKFTGCALQIYYTKYSEVFINLKCPQNSLGNFMERFTYV